MLKNFICLLYIFYINYDTMYAYTPQEYGKFKFSILAINVCKGPKRINCCNIAATMTNDTHLNCEIDVVKTNIPNRGKIILTMNNHQLLRFQMKKPCDHLYIKPIFQIFLNASPTCEFRKGKLHTILDLEKKTQQYYRGEFLYKSIFYNDECNFSCTELSANFAPAKES